jgi:hypothetical protein
LDNDENTVTVDEIESLLDENQKDELQTEIGCFDVHCFSQLEMISKFYIAKMFVYNVCRQN